MSRKMYLHGLNGVKNHFPGETAFRGTPVKLDVGKILEKHSIKYKGPTEKWQTGLPVGNGDLAAMIYQDGGEICWGLTKSDIRDLRNPVVPFHTDKEMRETILDKKDYLEADHINEEEWYFRKDCYFPCFLPSAGLFISALYGNGLDLLEQKLDLYSASHTAKFKNGGTVTSFVYCHENVLALRISQMKKTKLKIKILPEAIDPGSKGKQPDFLRDSGFAETMRKEVFRSINCKSSGSGMQQEVFYADGNAAMTVLEIKGGVLQPVDGEDNSAVIDITEDNLDIMLSVVTAREGAFLKRRASRIIENAFQRNFERLLGDHANSWHETWSRSIIQIPDAEVEREWFFFVYTMNSSGKGAYPVPLMSAWNIRLDQPYHGDYHNNINSQMCYWPVFAANFPELAEVYIKHFWEVMPVMESETRRVWGREGVKIPFACAGSGREFWGVGYWRYEHFVSAWTAQIAWWHYEFTGDREFLQKYGWPLIKGVADFYMAYLEKNPVTGKLSLLTKPVEDTLFNSTPDKRLVMDSIADLSAVHGHFRDASKAAMVLGEKETAEKFDAVLKQLVPLSVQNGEFSIYENCPCDLPVSHPYTIQPIYPTEMVTSLGPEKLVSVARKTLENVWNCASRVTENPEADGLFWVDDLSMGWLGVCHAWMGNGEKALRMIREGWLKNCLLPNLFLSSQAAPVEKRPEKMWMQNQLSGFANVVNEMLLQSHGGVIQIFPAVPAGWKDLLFVNMRARGALIISAAKEKGRTKWVTINSLNGGDTVLRNPWVGTKPEKISITDTDSGEKIRFSVSTGNLKFKLKKGQCVFIFSRTMEGRG